MIKTLIIVLSILFIGILFGYVFKSKLKRYEKIINNLLMLSIYFLLFFMGVSIGRDKTLMQNLTKLGLNALIITIGTVLGSLILALILYKIWKK